MSTPDQNSSLNPNKTTYSAIPIPNRQSHSNNGPVPRASMYMNSPNISSFKGNSLSAFASSYRRAQSFRSLEPRLNAARSYFQDDEELIDPDTLAPSQLGRKISTVFYGRKPSFDSSTFDEAAVADDVSFADHSYGDWGQSRSASIQSYAASSFAGGHALASVLSNDADSVFLKQVEDRDGKLVTMIAPRSTVAQTVFNSINVLIGIGMLALAKAMTYAGWYCGIGLLLFSVAITYWTASLLSKCMDTDPTLCTFADLGYKVYGAKGRFFISLLFSVELLGVGVSLIVLFADSLNALFPEISIIQFKFIAFCVLSPFSFLSLRVLSGISLLGITCTISLILLTVTVGLTKQTSPGSLLSPMPTNLYPASFSDLMISFGIILGPFGSHSLFPALKSDLAQPEKFEKCLKITYSVGFVADSTMALAGFAMFGLGVMNEITKSILLIPSGIPYFVFVLTSAFVAVIPIAKTPINATPVINILEFMFGLTNQQLDGNQVSLLQSIGKICIKLFVNMMFVLISIVFPEFDKIIGLSGASLCTIICIILPCGFYLELCKPKNRWVYITTMVLASIVGVLATFAALYY